MISGIHTAKALATPRLPETDADMRNGGKAKSSLDRLLRRCKFNTWPLYNNTRTSTSASQIGRRPRFFVLYYRDVMNGFRIYLPARLWINQVETNDICLWAALHYS